ncbi:hypothetical protein NW768_004906 [Fusarium equiseti]|uniref:Uncharacterized protein n=1 Tax=Fusarium equiseti TaxID=61235 RepID=A0ABQ8RHJ3_FUSEQ|nr:hypothetical protein NW768_004906 [Fusarium equiseti]
MPSTPGYLREVQPTKLEFQFDGGKELTVKLNLPLFGLEQTPVTLEYNSPDQLHSGQPVRGIIQGTSWTLDIGTDVKIIGHQSQPSDMQPVDGLATWKD